MTKRCLMTICSALLALSTALAQETPVTKTADNGITAPAWKLR